MVAVEEGEKQESRRRKTGKRGRFTIDRGGKAYKQQVELYPELVPLPITPFAGRKAHGAPWGRGVLMVICQYDAAKAPRETRLFRAKSCRRD